MVVPSSSSSVIGTPAAGPQTTSVPPPPVQVHHSSALFASVPTRALHISPITPPTGNHQVGSDIRAPAPHLQPFRPAAAAMPMSSSSSSASLPSLLMPIRVGMPNQQPALISPSTSSSLLPQPRLPLTSFQNAGGLPPNTPPISLMELLMDVDNQIGPNPWSVFPPPASNTSSNLDTSEPRALDVPPAPAPAPAPAPTPAPAPAPAPPLVCLSDDDD